MVVLRSSRWVLGLAFALGSLGCSAGQTSVTASATPGGVDGTSGGSEPLPSVGLLVMAHGGGAEWNSAVETAVGPLRASRPTELAFGMASPTTLAASIAALEAQDVDAIVVVRLFVSGESFLHQTEFLLGLRPDPPARGLVGHHEVDGASLVRVPSRVPILLDLHGMADSPLIHDIVVARSREAAHGSSSPSVLLLAHGMGDAGENDRLLGAMERGADVLRAQGFPSVQTATLREDWAPERASAEDEIRGTLRKWEAGGATAVVVPFRLFGFGPYGEVLEGLDYVAGRGFLPDSRVGDWIEHHYRETLCASSWLRAVSGCSAAEPLFSGERASEDRR